MVDKQGERKKTEKICTFLQARCGIWPVKTSASKPLGILSRQLIQMDEISYFRFDVTISRQWPGKSQCT